MKVMLDTNICIYVIKRKPQAVLDRFLTFEVGDAGISIITLAELEYGGSKSQNVQKNRQALQQFIKLLEVVRFDHAAAYGNLRATLKLKDQTIGSMDLLVAAHALSSKVRLITNNEREFERVSGLRVENLV